MVGKADMWFPHSPAVVKVEKDENSVPSSSCGRAGMPAVAAFFGAFMGWSCSQELEAGLNSTARLSAVGA